MEWRCNISLNNLLKIHIKNKKIATITAVRPPLDLVVFLKKNTQKNSMKKSN